MQRAPMSQHTRPNPSASNEMEYVSACYVVSTCFVPYITRADAFRRSFELWLPQRLAQPLQGCVLSLPI